MTYISRILQLNATHRHRKLTISRYTKIFKTANLLQNWWLLFTFFPQKFFRIIYCSKKETTSVAKKK